MVKSVKKAPESVGLPGDKGRDLPPLTRADAAATTESGIVEDPPNTATKPGAAHPEG